jgi:hypothetical protein
MLWCTVSFGWSLFVDRVLEVFSRFAKPDLDLDPYYFLEAGSGSAIRVKSWIRIRICIRVKAWIRIRIKVSNNLGAVEAQNGALEGFGCSRWRLGGSKWSLGGSVVD